MRLDPAHFLRAVGNAAPRGPLELNLSSPQARGLAAAWPLFAGPGAGLRDLSGNGAHLALGIGALTPAWVTRPGLDGRALDFNTDEAHVDAGDVPSLDIVGDRLSIAAWIRPDDTGNTDGERIVSKRTDAGGSDVYALFTITSFPAGIWFRLNAGGSTTDLQYTTPVTVGVWQHWAATYDGAAMRLYRNGVEVASTAKTGNIANSARAVYLGHREGEARHFNGAMAEVRVYDRSLSAREVRALHDPSARWSLYRETTVPRVWPARAGASRTAIASLAAALQRQTSLTSAAGAALRAEAALAVLVDVALERAVPNSLDLDTAAKAFKSARLDLNAALKRSQGAGTGLDANLNSQALSQRAAAIDGAVRRLNALSGALEAALGVANLDTATLDAWLAQRFAGSAGLDAAAQSERLGSGPALQGVLRARAGGGAALDAVVGLVIAAADSRTFKVAARGRHAVAPGRRQSAIPSGNRRH